MAKKPDLTYFRFNAMRWFMSESVRAMTTLEKGQYIELMVHSWLKGRNATLPVSTKELAKLAGVKKLSKTVLAMFPIVNDPLYGRRRRNETIQEEWVEIEKRVDEGRANSRKRWEKGDGEPSGTHKAPNARREVEVEHTKTDYVTPPEGGLVSSETEGENNMASIAKRFTEDCLSIWQEVYGPSAALQRPESSKHTDKKDWLFLVERYDGELLRKAFRLYAEEANGSDKWALCKFINKAAEYMQRVQPLKAAEAPKEDAVLLAVREAAGKRDNEEQTALHGTILEGRRKPRQSEEGANPDDFFTEE